MSSTTATNNYYIGIMSGTSVDGIDVVLAEVTEQRFLVIASSTTPIELTLKQDILRLCESQQTSLAKLGELTHQLTLTYGEAVNSLLHNANLKAPQVSAIGCHGQTICHAPKSAYPFTMQIVDAALLAAKTGIPVVHDFRSMDVALGGEGAPLIPLFHDYLLSLLDEKKRPAEPNQAFLNIGGMANLSVFTTSQTIGFDTGPGNVLIDLWCQTNFNCDYDQDGQLAASGRVDQALLTDMLSDPYFNQPYPKSTGREYFNLAWLQQHTAHHQTSDIDVLTTITQLTAISIADALNQHGTLHKHVAEGQQGLLWLFGGGSHNIFLLEQLSKLLPGWRLESSAALAVSPDDMEAAAFAWLTYRRMSNQSGNLPSVTGATQPSICGSLTLPPNSI